MNYDDIWSKVLDILRVELNPVSFGTWINGTSIYEINDKSVILLVPMYLYKKQFLTHYYDLITEAFNTVLGEFKELDCVIKGEEVDKIENVTTEIVDNDLVINNDSTDITFESNLNENLTFENFVVGDTNKFARTAAFAVAQNPGTTYNPLFIYGKSGLGKTHLMHAIGNYINENNPKLRVLYTTSDDFRKDYTGIANSNDNSMDYANNFKKKYRDIDVLIIDDIQYLVGAEKTQEEFFHTFNDLH